MWRKFKQWCFQWVQDHEGDIGLKIAGCVTFVKYKDSTLVYWFHPTLKEAGKHQGSFNYMDPQVIEKELAWEESARQQKEKQFAKELPLNW